MVEDVRDDEQLAAAGEARAWSWLVATSERLPGELSAERRPGTLEAPEQIGDQPIAADVIDGVRLGGNSFEFTRSLLEAVIGASDPFAAAMGLREVSRNLPDSMPGIEKLAVRVGGIASLGLPWAVLPLARKVLRDRLAHLVLVTKIAGNDATDAGDTSEKVLTKLRRALTDARGTSPAHLLISLTGSQVLGHHAAQKQVQRLRRLTQQPEVTDVAIDIERLAPAGLAGMWAIDADARRAGNTLRELLQFAAQHDTRVTIEARSYRGALLAVAALVHALDTDQLDNAQAGVMLAAELPESVQQAETLIALSSSRVARGASPIEIGVGTPLSLGHEHINALHTGLPVALIEDPAVLRSQHIRLTQLLMRHTPQVRVVVATEDPQLLAVATLLAEQHGDSSNLSLQLRAGIAPVLEHVIADNGYAVRRRLPLTPPSEIDGVLDYLIALAAESSQPDSVIARVREQLQRIADHPELSSQFSGTELTEVLLQAAGPAPSSHRVQQRRLEFDEQSKDTVVLYREPAVAPDVDTGGLTAAVLALTRAHTGELTFDLSGPGLQVPAVSSTGFAGEPDTDASKAENRAWARELLDLAADRSATPGVGNNQHDPEAALRVVSDADEPDHLDQVIDGLLQASTWRTMRPSERAARMARLARESAAARNETTVALAAETEQPVAVIDRDVNNAIDAVRYVTQLTPALGSIRGATFTPRTLTLLVFGLSVPLAERAEALIAALATGSSVLALVHQQDLRSTQQLCTMWINAGLPAETLAVCSASTAEHFDALMMQLAADERTQWALVHADRTDASAMLRRRPGLGIEARFRAQGVCVVAPSADIDVAARDIVASAFGAGHLDARRAQAVVTLGQPQQTAQLLRQIEDAVRAIEPGSSLHTHTHDADALAVSLGPLPALPDEAGWRALTELAEGESWAVEPEQLDTEGLLWRPGVRVGVKPDASFWADAVGMPVIGVLHARTVSDAIELCNSIGAGGVAAMHANDPAEMLPFIERVQASSLVINRPTTPWRIERQPDGAWGTAGRGHTMLRGGPNRLLTMGDWQPQQVATGSTLHLRGLKPEVALLIEAAQSSLNFTQFDGVRRAALADALTWRSELGRLTDVTQLGIERNFIRHLPASTHVRLSEGAEIADAVRVLAAGLVAGAPMSLSTGIVLPHGITELLEKAALSVSLERDDDWLERISVSGLSDDEIAPTRIRLIGGDALRTAEWLAGQPNISLWAEPVTAAGPVELLAFVREQSITICANRHGLSILPAGIGGWISEQQARA